MLYHTHSVNETIKSLETSTKTGLSTAQVERRQQQYGLNQVKLDRTPLWRIIIEPFANVFMAILAAAALLSVLHQEPLDFFIIVFIMIANALIFYAQTYSTQRVMRSLERKSQQKVRVVRNKEEVEIDATLLVPGDILLLSEGEKVPADGRILTNLQLRTNESQLTGESEPVSKQVQKVASTAAIFERSNMIYQGSFVVSGSATVAVTATANQTEFGSIARLVEQSELISPIQRKIDTLLRQIIIVVLAAALVAFGLALFRGMDIFEALSFVMALTVSAVPESLPVAISVVLVLGMRRMAARKALVQTMRSIETIGAVTTIATDKTGTLTKNNLRLVAVWQPESTLADIAEHAQKTITRSEYDLTDPLDQAIDQYAKTEGLGRSRQKPARSYSFDQSLAMSGALWHDGAKYKLHLKGAPEQVIERCNLNEREHKKVNQELSKLTKKGYRVIAIAHSLLDKPPDTLQDIPRKHTLSFDGLIAVVDELRPEAASAIQAAARAGVTVRMITGDHAETAYHIGKQLGMLTERSQVFDSRQMSSLSDAELRKKIEDSRVFARVLPEQKYRILTLLKKHNITAMTGDGVNDVPALSSAHVGLAMGSGSSIARDAGDIILLDDNFKTVIDALKEGRAIIANIRRMLYFLLSTNASELLTMLVALAVGMPLPLLPVQILWVNLVTDSFMVIPLGLEPPQKNILEQKPTSPRAPILPRAMVVRMLLMAFSMATVTILSFGYFLHTHGVDYARTVAFHVLVIMQLGAALAARSEFASITHSLRTWSASFYVGLGLTLLVHGLTLFSPLGSLLRMVQLSAADIALTTLYALTIPILVSELHKWQGRRSMPRRI
jgi:Ca2+-transporting ATPase